MVRPRCTQLLAFLTSPDASAQAKAAGAGSERPEVGLAASAVGERRSGAALRMLHTQPPDASRGFTARPQGLKGHLPAKGLPESWGAPGRRSRRPRRAQAHSPAPASRALPARGESGSPLTTPTRRHWKSLRTSSQLCTPSFRAAPTRASSRRQRQPMRHVCASIIGVPATPSPYVHPSFPARPALYALEKARRPRFPGGAMRRRAFRDRSGTPASPGSPGLLPAEPGD